MVLFKKIRDSTVPAHQFYDLTGDGEDMFVWINEASLQPLEELSPESYKIGDTVKKPMYLAFINRKHPKYAEKSLDLYEKLTEIAPKYPQFIFMFTEDTENVAKKRYLGINWKEEPAMAMNYMKSSGSIVFPRSKAFTKKNIEQFIDDYISGEVEVTTTSHYMENQYIALMPNVQHISSRDFEKVCLTKGYDVLLLMYDAYGDEEENTMAAKFYEKTASRFKDISIITLKVVAYDIYEHSIPLELEYTQDLPQLIFFPAYHKSPPYRYFQDIRAEKLMRKVQESSDIKFNLPENYHLNEEEVKRFAIGLPLEDL